MDLVGDADDGALNMKLSRLSIALALGAALAGCGGGNSAGDPSVATISASPTRYGATMTIAIVGRNLGSTELAVDGRCDNLTKAAGATDDAVQYTCTVRTVGDLVPRVRVAGGSRELGSVRATIPTPRVSVTLTDGSRSGTFVVELDPVAAPLAVDNFLAYVGTTSAASFYRSTAVTYVDPTVGILMGGYTVGAAGVLVAKAATRPAIALEASASRLHLRGTVGMYRRGDENSATTEWFVNTQNNAFLDVGSAQNPAGFTIFGTVVDGLDIVDIAAGVAVKTDLGTGFTNVPDTPMTISAISQTR
jgi:peptidyl-prolyl cis-trans isomerase A (cyclophilin A)